MQTWSLVSICVLLCIVVRWSVSLNSYSGMNCLNLTKNTRNPDGSCQDPRSPLPILEHYPGEAVTHFINSLRGLRCRHPHNARVCVCAPLSCHSPTWCCIQWTNSWHFSLQGRGSLRCLGIMKPRDTGKKWPTTSPCRTGACAASSLYSLGVHHRTPEV